MKIERSMEVGRKIQVRGRMRYHRKHALHALRSETSPRPQNRGHPTTRQGLETRATISSVSARLLETAGAQPRPDTTALGARRRRFGARDDDAEVKSAGKDMDYKSFPLRLITNSKPRFFNEGYLQKEAMYNLILTQRGTIEQVPHP